MHIQIKGQYTPDPDGFVSFGDVSRNELGKQCQYGSLYIDGSAGSPNLGEGLRFRKHTTGNYHDALIHQDDIAEFVRRFHAYRQRNWGLTVEVYQKEYLDTI